MFYQSKCFGCFEKVISIDELFQIEKDDFFLNFLFETEPSSAN